MKTFTQIAICWTLMWGLAYFATGLFTPEIMGSSTLIGFLTCDVLGGAIIFALELRQLSSSWRTLARVMLVILALVEISGGILSWSGASLWNIPFANKEIFQVSMAFADLVSAVFMLYLAVYND